MKREIGYNCHMKNLLLALVLIISLSGCDVFSSKEKELKQKEEELAQRERELRKRENESSEPTKEERKQPEVEEKKNEPEEPAEEVYLYQSNEMGYNEYIKRVGNRYYYSTDKVKYVRMGRSTDRNNRSYFYFQNKPNVHYYIGGACCGFDIVNPDGKSQFYEQISPTCESP